MPKMRTLPLVDVDYATAGPNRAVLRQAVAAPAANLFRALADGPAWKEWLGIEVEWTSPRPFGVGTTRTVRNGRIRIDEEFLVWDEDSRMNFYFTAANLPVAAFGEDYRIEPGGDDSSTLVWSYAYEWAGPLPAVTGPIFGRLFARNGRRALARLATFMADSGDRFEP